MAKFTNEAARQFQKNFKKLINHKGRRAKRRKRCWRCDSLYHPENKTLGGMYRDYSVMTLRQGMKRVKIEEPICEPCQFKIVDPERKERGEE